MIERFSGLKADFRQVRGSASTDEHCDWLSYARAEMALSQHAVANVTLNLKVNIKLRMGQWSYKLPLRCFLNMFWSNCYVLRFLIIRCERLLFMFYFNFKFEFGMLKLKLKIKEFFNIY